jgi:hypothetical protein
MKIFRTYDIALVLSILKTKGLWEHIQEDGCGDGFIPNVVEDIHLVVQADGGAVVGCLLLKPIRAFTWEAHINIIPEHREKHALEAAETMFKWAMENIPNLKKIVSFVPEKYKNVVNFAKFVGFKEEGFITESYQKDGDIIGEHILGITINEIEARWG